LAGEKAAGGSPEDFLFDTKLLSSIRFIIINKAGIISKE